MEGLFFVFGCYYRKSITSTPGYFFGSKVKRASSTLMFGVNFVIVDL
jgi:hypothetical protein